MTGTKIVMNAAYVRDQAVPETQRGEHNIGFPATHPVIICSWRRTDIAVFIPILLFLWHHRSWPTVHLGYIPAGLQRAAFNLIAIPRMWFTVACSKQWILDENYMLAASSRSTVHSLCQRVSLFVLSRKHTLDAQDKPSDLVKVFVTLLVGG